MVEQRRPGAVANKVGHEGDTGMRKSDGPRRGGTIRTALRGRVGNVDGPLRPTQA
jgi:hypothetical protein